MTRSEIRDELLSQHAGLRARLDIARRAVERWALNEIPRDSVRDELAALADALRSHNLREEGVRDMIRAVDAWGPARVEIMEEAHVREHHHLFDALVALQRTEDPREGVRELERLRTRLLEHMAREEETFLNVDVLRDDDVAIDAQEG
ncbi:MAG TPA: hemerythrin domain-containing protein [Polyangiaceae bacterium]|jgi:hypothetical protein